MATKKIAKKVATKKTPIKKTKKIVEQVQENVEVSTDQVEHAQETQENCAVEVEQTVDPVVLSSKTWIEPSKTEIQPIPQWSKIHVLCKQNCWSFQQGREYFLSTRVFENYKSILEVIE